MNSKIYCSVCDTEFYYKDGTPEKGKVVICTICGAALEITETAPAITARRASMPPDDEIRGRIDVFAKLKGYVFKDDHKEKIIKGLLKKHSKFGDFYCPCRIENTSENVCPCRETRMEKLTGEGSCRCGLFYKV